MTPTIICIVLFVIALTCFDMGTSLQHRTAVNLTAIHRHHVHGKQDLSKETKVDHRINKLSQNIGQVFELHHVPTGSNKPEASEADVCSNGQMPMFVVSLNTRYDRWERVFGRLMSLKWLDPTLCIEVERAVATSGETDNIPAQMVTKNWTTERNRMYVGNGTWYDKVEQKLSLTPGERGCAASHIRLWKKVAKMNGPAIIAEDDAVPKQDFGKILRQALKEVPDDADILYLGYSRPDKAPFRGSSGPSIVEVDYVWTTVGYIIWPRGAQKLLKRLPIDSPVDNFMSWASHTNETKAYALKSPVIYQELPWNIANEVEHSDELSKEKKEREEFRKQVSLFTRPLRKAQESLAQETKKAILQLDEFAKGVAP